MKKFLLPEGGTFYKANLHCHTTCSDGLRTPEQIKELYKAHGYAIVAYTDHNVMLDHSDLNDEDFLALVGYELNINEPDYCTPIHTCHMCFIAKERGLDQVCWHRSKYLNKGALENKGKAKFDESLPDYERYYAQIGINDAIKRAKDGGFFVTYNHPYWSLESYPQYTSYQGMDAMEIYNHSCVVSGYDDYNPLVYDDMLRTGHRIYCIAADDNHNAKPDGTPMSDACGGFTMIKADKLEYAAIIDALEKGSFYASNGPEITSLWYEDGQVHITTSEAVSITMQTGSRHAGAARADVGKTVNKAVFTPRPTDVYVRFTVTDASGKKANTNAYFLDELMK